MSTLLGSPKLVKGGLVLVNSTTGRALRVIALQYNPDTMTRPLSPQSAGGGRHEPLRLKAPAIETIRLKTCDRSEGMVRSTHDALPRATMPALLGFGLASQQAEPERGS